MTGTMSLPPAAPTSAAPTADVTHAFAVAPAAGNDGLWFSARDSGIWTSNDAGVTWRQVFGAGSPDRRITVTSLACAADVAARQTVFAGAFGAVVRSIDGGRQWRAVELPSPAPLVTSLAVSPAYDEDGVVLAGTLEDGVLRSDDRGEHWKRWNFGLLDLAVYAIALSPNYAQDDTLFAGTETALFKSENGGRSWRETTFPETSAPVLALAFDHHGTLWAGTDGHGIWRWADDGATWHRADDGSLSEPVNGFVVTTHPLLAVLPEAILSSHDQGKQWHTAISGVSDGGGIAGVAFGPPAPNPSLPDSLVSGGIDLASRARLRGGNRPVASADGDWSTSGPTAGHYDPKLSGREAPNPGGDFGGNDSTGLLVQLRDGSVRRLRIDLGNDTGKGTR